MLEVKVSNRDSYLNISPSCLGSVGMLSSIFYRQVYTAQCIDKLEINLVSFTTGVAPEISSQTGALASCPCSHHPRRRPCTEAGEAEQPRFPPAHMRASKLAHDHRGRLGSTSSISSRRSAEHRGKASPPLPSPQGQPRPWYRSFLVASPLSHSGHTGVPSSLNFPGLQRHGCDSALEATGRRSPVVSPAKPRRGPLLQWPPPTAKILPQTLSLLELLLSGSHPETRQTQARSHWSILYENSKTPERTEKTLLITLQGLS